MTESGNPLSGACTAFGINLYKTLASSDDSENLMVSPFCLHNVLSMAYFGAEGATKSQIKDVLNLGEGKDDELRDAFSKILSVDVKDSALIANRMYLDNAYSILESFTKICKEDFKADAVNVDFQGAISDAEKTINGWVKESTKGKIQEVLQPNSLKSNTAMLLLNAIFFKADWDVKFDPSLTVNRLFIMGPDNEVEIPFMRRMASFRTGYSEELDCATLELPYKDGAFSMFVALPSETNGIFALEKKLDTKMLPGLFGSMAEEKLELILPRFTLSSTMKLSKNLGDMGMTDCFVAGKADLSGIDGTKNLYVSDVFHKVVIDVNEDGTEAAAAGAVGIETRMLPRQFNADHPFLFCIRNNKTKMILFFGRFVNPKN
ncbi:hypothetical protein LOTGIDRAFT_198226 [Lottia gigantea]|uniref:Serpin domain-containing protein n=1 Tax=Lottia gigantea TaxID=225164 RepID=V3ZMU0_LOTGI|nr:hypothetical protein LOTGIDRAFT_198226 [Lottia gigantea]ESO82151.1 hypothetical protein LOTGIDRAFT_198226 [Lottia gigantea]